MCEQSPGFYVRKKQPYIEINIISSSYVLLKNYFLGQFKSDNKCFDIPLQNQHFFHAYQLRVMGVIPQEHNTPREKYSTLCYGDMNT